MTPDALATLHALAFTDTPRPWTAAEFATLLAEPTTLLATQSDGFALGRTVGPEAELLTLAVHPDARRRGIGAQLVRAIETAAVGHGAEACLLEVAADNAPARALYDGLGYKLVGRRAGYYVRALARPSDALVLRRQLLSGARGKTI